MAKGQRRSNKEPKKLKNGDSKDKGPRYMRIPELVQSSKSALPRASAKR
jgi:hypothetical protein